jgi:type II secretion system protein I
MSAKSGFTLLEVLIALAVLSIVMSGFVYQLQDHSRLSWQVSQKVAGGRWLNNKLSEFQLTPSQVATGVRQQIIAYNNYNWVFKSEIETTNYNHLFSLNLELYEVGGAKIHGIEGYVINER